MPIGCEKRWMNFCQDPFIKVIINVTPCVVMVNSMMSMRLWRWSFRPSLKEYLVLPVASAAIATAALWALRRLLLPHRGHNPVPRVHVPRQCHASHRKHRVNYNSITTLFLTRPPIHCKSNRRDITYAQNHACEDALSHVGYSCSSDIFQADRSFRNNRFLSFPTL